MFESGYIVLAWFFIVARKSFSSHISSFFAQRFHPICVQPGDFFYRIALTFFHNCFTNVLNYFNDLLNKLKNHLM